MQFDILTLFPEIFDFVVNTSIIGKAVNNGIITVNAVNIRDYSTNKHKKVDDYPFGGGSGMVMTPQPIYDAYQSLTSKYSYKPHCIYLSPQGKVFDQAMAKRLHQTQHLILLCGHYEGIDERVIDEIVDEEVSIGNYVLTGGELPALVLIDTISRLVPGVLGAENGFIDDSLYNGMLEYPQYTRPANYKGSAVPEILLSGHHKNIEKWRYSQSLIRTYHKRPDLFRELNLSDEDNKIIQNALIDNNDKIVKDKTISDSGKIIQNAHNESDIKI